jgi:predicted transcriptional regulator
MFNTETTIKEFGFVRNHIVATPRSNLSEIAGLLLNSTDKTIPIVEQGKLLGILSVNDILKLPKEESKLRVEDVMTRNAITLTEKNKLSDAIKLLISKQYLPQTNQSTRISSIPIIKDDQTFLGMFTYKFALVKFKPIIKELNVGAVYLPDREIIVVEEDDTIETVYFILNQKGIRQILVVDKRNKKYVPVGVVTDTDVLKNLGSSENELVRDIMMQLDYMKILTMRHLLPRVVNLLTERKLDLKIFPIVQNSELVGIISYADIFRTVLRTLESATPKHTDDGSIKAAINASTPMPPKA